MKLLFVCLGNICRSPLAEALMKYHVQNLELSDSFFIDSCGTGNWHQGESPDKRTLDNALKNSLDITHKARQIKSEDIAAFDYIFVMDQHNLTSVLSTYPQAKDKLFLVSHFSKLHPNAIIPDPYYGEEEDFQMVFDLLNSITKELAIYFKHQQ
jgi:protein-tyrosine phosphatase